MVSAITVASTTQPLRQVRQSKDGQQLQEVIISLLYVVRYLINHSRTPTPDPESLGGRPSIPESEVSQLVLQPDIRTRFTPHRELGIRSAKRSFTLHLGKMP